MFKNDDPRVWQRRVKSGAISSTDSQTAALIGVVADIRGKLAAGQTVAREPITGKFVSLRGLRERTLAELGRRVAGN